MVHRVGCPKESRSRLYRTPRDSTGSRGSARAPKRSSALWPVTAPFKLTPNTDHPRVAWDKNQKVLDVPLTGRYLSVDRMEATVRSVPDRGLSGLNNRT